MKTSTNFTIPHYYLCFLIGITFVLSACMPKIPIEQDTLIPAMELSSPTVLYPTTSPEEIHDQTLFTHKLQMGNFNVYGTDVDQQEITDVSEALLAYSQEINKAIDFDFHEDISVEIFPDQDSLDQFGMNPEMQGFYAYSGNNRIQMVSPRNPTVQPEIGYEQRVLIAVHEYVHLVINAINMNLPVWLNEGAAIYFTPHEIYTWVCQNQFPFEKVPSFNDLEQSYESVPYADLYAFSMVEFITTEYGIDKLNRLIRSPDQLVEILGDSKYDFEQKWRKFMEENYSSD